MTVAELIKRLQAVPQDLPVVIPSMLGSIDDYHEGLVTSKGIAIEGAKYDATAADGAHWRRWPDSPVATPSDPDAPVQVIVVIE